MRLPWVQLTWEFIDQAAPDVALLLGISENEAIGGLVKMVQWGLGRCPDDRPPSESSGVMDPDAARFICRAAGFTIDPERLVDACERCRPALLERVEGGIRFRGFDRYDTTWRRNRRKGHGLDEDDDDPRGTRGEPARENRGNTAQPARKTQTQTQTQKKPPPAGERAQPELSVVVNNEEPPEGEEDLSTSDGFWVWWQRERERFRQMRREKKRPDGWADWHAAAIADVGETDLNLAACRYLADEHFRDRGWPTAIFMSDGVWRIRARPLEPRRVRS